MTPREGERQRRILYAAAFLRALAIGLMAVLIALYAARVGMTAAQIGVILSAALWGAALATVITLWIGPKLSERALLVGLCIVPAAGCAIFLAGDHRRCGAHEGLRLVQRAAGLRIRGRGVARRASSRPRRGLRPRHHDLDARDACAFLRAVPRDGPALLPHAGAPGGIGGGPEKPVARKPPDRREDRRPLPARCLRRRLRGFRAARVFLRRALRGLGRGPRGA